MFTPMGRRRAFLVAYASSLAIVTAGLALAQRRPPPRAKPPAVDAGAPDNPYADEKPEAKDAKDTKRADAGAASAPVASAAQPEGPVAKPDLYDGGVKPSPLNPAPNEFPDGGAPPQSLDYDRLLADIAALRARVAAVSDTMFHSRLVVAIETSGDHGRIARLTVSLDDGVVYEARSPQGFRADDLTTIYDHAVAPGRHAVTIDVDRKDDREESFRTSQRSRFTIDVPRDNRLQLDVRIWDDSNMGADFPGDKSGRYELKIRAKASAKPVPNGVGGGK